MENPSTCTSLFLKYIPHMRTVLLLDVSAGLFCLAPNMLIIITLGVCGIFYVRVYASALLPPQLLNLEGFHT